MSIKTRVWRLLGKFDRRLTLVESTAERTEGAVDDMLAIATELKATAANLSATAARLEAAVAEQGRTLGGMLDTAHDERERRAGIGREQMAQSGRLDRVERKLGIEAGQ